MAIKHKALLDAARLEVKTQSKNKAKTNAAAPAPAAAKPAEEIKPVEQAAAADHSASQGPTNAAPPPPAGENYTAPDPPRDEFREQFEECFKEMGNFASGAMVVEMIDDFKANGFLVYCKKHKIEGVTKDMLLMTGKPKQFASFCVDHAIKNSLFEWVKKYPILGAALVMAVSAGGTFVMLNALKGKNAEMEEMKKQLEKYQAAEKAAGLGSADPLREQINSL